MVTISQSDIVKPVDRLSLHTSSISPIPKSLFLALKDPHWCNAMYGEYNVLVKNGTWILVPRPSSVNLVRFMWLFKHKFHADGTLSRYKARLVANDSIQQLGVDFDEKFSPIVKPATIRTVLSLVVSRKWPIHQLDVKNAFLNSDLSMIVFMHQPLRFIDSRYPHHVCLLQRSLYGLRQAPHGSQVAYLLIYVYDIILTASSPALLSRLSTIYKRKYALQLLERAHMVHCNPSRTPVDTESTLGPKGPLGFCLYLYASTTTSLVGYTDADRACCPSTHRSASGYCVFFGDNLLSWSANRQHTLSRSNAKAEYRGVANIVAETAWLRNLLRELHSPLSTATLVYCDNVSAIYMLEFYMYPAVISMPISSPGDCLQPCLNNFDPLSV
ncbi:ribonuclease H-like domain-containing protein [Tanacetum coccineum]